MHRRWKRIQQSHRGVFGTDRVPLFHPAPHLAGTYRVRRGRVANRPWRMRLLPECPLPHRNRRRGVLRRQVAMANSWLLPGKSSRYGRWRQGRVPAPYRLAAIPCISPRAPGSHRPVRHSARNPEGQPGVPGFRKWVFRPGRPAFHQRSRHRSIHPPTPQKRHETSARAFARVPSPGLKTAAASRKGQGWCSPSRLLCVTREVFFFLGVHPFRVSCYFAGGPVVTGFQRFGNTNNTSNTGFSRDSGLHASNHLAEMPLHHVAFLQFVQVIGIPLHHGAALLQVDRLVVDAGHPVFSVGQLCLDMIFRKAMFP
ncbi:hypothetical protein SAMN04244573_02073 [Azotobacter beijerinckii]|uniref:Uncharacterized protein n=1 Tax=Azotobacter beijerinckii TaxID=170623 RepID=A0A1H9I5A0_9GAMM|nr:hypothetical protein SAMN04244573_02073 [Azotobacter beijerinckii]